ncbi:hypothetical protein AAZX31_03G137700 [Glycine max]|uniref:FLZ-type domain-containing protein n=2 Tax=Glycine subgen. Soja TaxID=1462606 RepID=I1JNW1_SOYBN|nr:protein MARD1 [Glycine max]XP_028225504.1 protein MARD1-like [Glycine soja]KAG5043520.1 hypothetical protein JHK87_007435 [Glycine soja]KAG5055307.1 hypothetical protein JHK85_007817 [Glycine max]KAG5072379.1 hypothetical protein JHK86_007590 [Glycine max]KAH1070190.1 hypothetical protein GYH30_007346 [Glycine max]KAH1258323.1 Protein MARD1 [Glycine max]|eukprot:XP_014629290.1 protein MARD1 [Glycine max]
MLLRNRSRAVTKPGLMADHSTQNSSPNQNYAKTIIPSLFGSPKFRDFTNKCLSSGTEALRSPTSILDARALSPFAFGSPFSTLPNKSSSQNRTWDKPDSKGGIGLALVGALKDEDTSISHNSEPNKGNVLLRVKIPFESQFQTCVDDFGTTKTNNGSKNSSGSGICAKDCCDSPRSGGVLSWSEMELSEEYTCVISHGPNPKATHIFNNCIVVETYCSLPQKHNSHHSAATSGNFLSFCYTCKKHLDQTKDIFIYRGEKAFCSRECRHREMMLDGIENLEFEN